MSSQSNRIYDFSQDEDEVLFYTSLKPFDDNLSSTGNSLECLDDNLEPTDENMEQEEHDDKRIHDIIDCLASGCKGQGIVLVVASVGSSPELKQLNVTTIHWVRDVLRSDIDDDHLLEVCYRLAAEFASKEIAETVVMNKCISTLAQLTRQLQEDSDEDDGYEQNVVLSRLPKTVGEQKRSWKDIQKSVEDINQKWFSTEVALLSVRDQALCIRVDNITDKDGKARKQLKLMTVVDDDICSEDDYTIEEDERERLEIQDSQDVNNTYYPSQICLASIIVKRIRFLFMHYMNAGEGRELDAFKYFDFRIYTARSKMLNNQIIQRLCSEAVGCFPQEDYKDEKRLQNMAKYRVRKYMKTKKIVDELETLKTEVNKNPTTLFLIIADEAQWGIWRGEGSTNSMIVNTWGDEFPNVVVILVTATHWNLMRSDIA